MNILDDDEIPDYKTAANNTSKDDEKRDIPLSSVGNFRISF
jgi:hypothetical protein